MTTYIDTKIVSLTSQSANIKYNGSFMSNVKYNLGIIVKSQPSIIHRQVQLLNAQIPYSFYVVNYTNNLLKTNILGSIVTYTIPTGNYNANNLISTILTTLGSPTGLTLSISSITGKLTFTYTSNFIIYNDFQYSIGNILGLSPNTNTSSASNILICVNPLNLLGIKSLQIRSTNLIMDNISSVQGGQTTLLSTIPVSCVPFGMIDYVDKGNHLITIYNDALDDLEIDIVDGETGELINFNGQDWCITLAFHLTHKIDMPPKTSFKDLREQSSLQNSTEPNSLREATAEQSSLAKDSTEPSSLEELNLLNT